MNEIDSLTRTVSDLGQSVDAWNRVVVAGGSVRCCCSGARSSPREGRGPAAQAGGGAVAFRRRERPAATKRPQGKRFSYRGGQSKGRRGERAQGLEVEAEQLRKQQSAQQRRGTVLMDPERRPEFRAHLLPADVPRESTDLGVGDGGARRVSRTGGSGFSSRLMSRNRSVVKPRNPETSVPMSSLRLLVSKAVMSWFSCRR